MTKEKEEDDITNAASMADAAAHGTSDELLVGGTIADEVMNVQNDDGDTGGTSTTKTSRRGRRGMFEAKSRPVPQQDDTGRGTKDGSLTHRERRQLRDALINDEESGTLSQSIASITAPGAVRVPANLGSFTQPTADDATVTGSSSLNQQRTADNIGSVDGREAAILTATLVNDTDATNMESNDHEIVVEATVFRPWKYIGIVGCFIVVVVGIALGIALPMISREDPLTLQPTLSPSESPTLSPLGIINEFLSPANLTVNDDTTEIGKLILVEYIGCIDYQFHSFMTQFLNWHWLSFY